MPEPAEPALAEARAEALAVVDLAIRAATAYGRPDRAAELLVARRRLAVPGARVLVVGAAQRGKSALVDELAGVAVCPTGPGVATALPTVVHHVAGRDRGEGASATLVAPDRRVPVGKAALAAALTDRTGTAAWTHAEVGLPDGAPGGLLADGLVLVDTPASTAVPPPEELAAAAAVVVVADAARALDPAELDIVARAVEAGPLVLVVLTRTDLAPRWRETRDADAARLVEVGLDVEVLGVSTVLARHDRRTGAEPTGVWSPDSGLAEVGAALRTVADPGGGRSAPAVLTGVVDVVAELAAALEAERAALADPEHAAALTAELIACRDRAARTRERSARWSQTLSDGVTDLVSDIDWDLRDRVRHVMRAAEEALDETDPATSWEAFSPWFVEQVAEAVATTFGWAGERTRRLAERVAVHFAEDDADVAALLPGAVAAPDGPAVLGARIVAELGVPTALEPPDLQRVGVGHGLVVGMRGSYGGVLMVGMVTTLSGLALINPFSVGAGLLLGTKTVRDERRRALARRRTEAKTAARRHSDEVLHQAGKRSRDMLREVQRALRDHFGARAESSTRAAAEAVAAAQAARDLATGARDRRLRDLQAEIARVAALAARAAAARDGLSSGRLVSTTPSAPPVAVAAR